MSEQSSEPPSFRFKCRSCDEWHEGIPALAVSAPDYFWSIPPEERESRCELTSDECIIDEEYFFVRGNLEIPVHELDETLTLGV